MTKDQVHKVVRQVGDYKLQDENQEVWVFRSDPNIRSIIVGFAPDNRVRYITAIAKPDGRPLPCPPLGNIKNAQVAVLRETMSLPIPGKNITKSFLQRPGVRRSDWQPARSRRPQQASETR